jgi:small-conductance mechanosensitive channel
MFTKFQRSTLFAYGGAGPTMPDLSFLDHRIAGGTLGDWVVALGVALVVILAVVVAKPILVRRFKSLAKRTSTRLDDALVHVVEATKIWLVAVIALYVGSNGLTLDPKAVKAIDAAATIALFLQVGLWGNALLEFLIRRSHRHALSSDGGAGAATSLSAMSFLGRILLWAIVLLLALDNLGINISTLVAGLGIGGVAVALAVQNILGDLFASLSIVIDKPFVIGDFIIVDTAMGTVEHVGLKTTRLRSLDGEQIVVSNSDLLKTRIRNYKRMYERRVIFRFGLTYDARPEQLEAIPRLVQGIIESHKQVRFERSHFWRFGESSLDFETVYWVTDPDYKLHMDIQQAIHLAVMREFARMGVAFAYPTRTLEIDAPLPVKPQGDGAKGAPRAS